MNFEEARKDNKEAEEGGGLMFYRCTMCGGVVSVWDIKEYHGCSVCSCNKIKPTNLSILEKIVQIIKHPKLWEWKQYEN